MGDIGNAISGAINSVEHALGDAAHGNLGGAINDLTSGATGAVGGLINGFMGASPDPGVIGGLSGVLGGLSKSGGVSVSTPALHPNPFSPGSLPGNISQNPLQGLGNDRMTKAQQAAQAIQQAIANEKGSHSRPLQRRARGWHSHQTQAFSDDILYSALPNLIVSWRRGLLRALI